MVRGDPLDQERTIARAVAAGVNYFDTAVQYGNGESEKNLGRVPMTRLRVASSRGLAVSAASLTATINSMCRPPAFHERKSQRSTSFGRGQPGA